MAPTTIPRPFSHIFSRIIQTADRKKIVKRTDKRCRREEIKAKIAPSTRLVRSLKYTLNCLCNIASCSYVLKVTLNICNFQAYCPMSNKMDALFDIFSCLLEGINYSHASIDLSNYAHAPCFDIVPIHS